MMRDCDNPKLFLVEVIDDAVRKPPHRKATPAIPPYRCEFRVLTQQCHRALEFRCEGKTQIGTALSGVMQDSVGKLLIRIGANRCLHPIAARAFAIASATGIMLERPASIASTRRSTSWAQARSTSSSWNRLAMSRSARAARSSALSFRACSSSASTRLFIVTLTDERDFKIIPAPIACCERLFMKGERRSVPLPRHRGTGY